MKISVTKRDIEAGRRSDPEGCPVARALRRAGVAHFGVTGMAVMVEFERQHKTVLLPSQVQEWILDFDWGTPVKPIDFDLAIPFAEAPSRVSTACDAPRRRIIPSFEDEPLLLPRLNLVCPKSAARRPLAKACCRS